MNERITQLAVQAGFVLIRDEYLFTEMMERFAKLIVQECIEIVETQRVPVRPSPSGEMAAKWTMDALRECRDEIKEHFGAKL